MASHKIKQEQYPDEFTVRASAPASGAYHMTERINNAERLNLMAIKHGLHLFDYLNGSSLSSDVGWRHL